MCSSDLSHLASGQISPLKEESSQAEGAAVILVSDAGLSPGLVSLLVSLLTLVLVFQSEKKEILRRLNHNLKIQSPEENPDIKSQGPEQNQNQDTHSPAQNQDQRTSNLEENQEKEKKNKEEEQHGSAPHSDGKRPAPLQNQPIGEGHPSSAGDRKRWEEIGRASCRERV